MNIGYSTGVGLIDDFFDSRVLGVLSALGKFISTVLDYSGFRFRVIWLPLSTRLSIQSMFSRIYFWSFTAILGFSRCFFIEISAYC